jgi:myo-inositol 2-dehydrogenase / D-chiro-inositol 1-dehydrogenase
MNSDNEQAINRRGFIQSSGCAAVGGSLIAPAVMAGPANTQTLKVGLIGCGGRGTSAALNALLADENVVLSTVGDAFADNIQTSLAQLHKRVPEKVKVTAGNTFVGLDSHERVVGTDVDMVILATPPVFRPVHLAAAVAAGKHSFVEITTAIDAPGVRSVLASAEIARRKGLAIVSGFCWRYDPALRAAQEQIRNGAIGEVRALYATYYRPNLGHKFKGERTPEMGDVEWQIRDWYHHLWLSGDVTVLLSGGHSVDKMAWWMNDVMPINAVAVGSQVFPNWGNTYDNAFVVYEYANGIRGFLGCRSQSGCYNDNGDEVIGTKGIFRFHRRRPVITGETNWRYKGPTKSMYQVEHDELFASIRTGKPINDGIRMAHTTLMTLMGRMAAYTGQQVTWDQALNSRQKLLPDDLTWDSKIEDQPLAVAGKTRFI